MGLTEHLRYCQTVQAATFDERSGRWDIETTSGKTYNPQFFIPSLGQLHHANTPLFDGRKSFTGEQFHSAEWPEDIDLCGKNVAVIGNAASAIQLIPEVAKQVSKLTVYQRSANWVAMLIDCEMN